WKKLRATICNYSPLPATSGESCREQSVSGESGVFPKELRIGAVYCGLVRITADQGGGFRTNPELEKQATLVWCGLLRMGKAPRRKPQEALTTKYANHTKGRG